MMIFGKTFLKKGRKKIIQFENHVHKVIYETISRLWGVFSNSKNTKLFIHEYGRFLEGFCFKGGFLFINPPPLFTSAPHAIYFHSNPLYHNLTTVFFLLQLLFVVILKLVGITNAGITNFFHSITKYTITNIFVNIQV